jgi:signal transduction histidine kinase
MWLSKLDAYLRHRSDLWWFTACVLLVAAITVLDYATGHELSLAILYLAPIFVSAWRLGRETAIAIAMMSAMGSLASMLLAGLSYSHPFYYFWDAALTFVTFALFALIISRLKIALDHADERFVTVLEGLDSSVFVTDDAGNLLYANEPFRKSVGEGADFLNAVREGARAHGPGAAAMQPVAGREGEYHDAERRRWYIIRSRAIRWVDGRTVYLHRAGDITDRKQAEELLRQQQEKLQMTSRLITIGEMASTLAHEMNQPLAAIANYTKGCVRRLRSGNWDEAELLAALEKTSAQAERAGKIIQRVRSFMNKREPAFIACNVNEVIRGVAALIEIEAETDSVVLTTELAPELPPVRADPVMIEQVVLNLAKNAIEAMREIPAGSRRLDIRSSSDTANAVEVAVSDSGPGIGPDFEQNLMAPFFTTKPRGMGLGLHICRSILEVHGGRLRASRNPAGGTTFSFTLPAAQP